MQNVKYLSGGKNLFIILAIQFKPVRLIWAPTLITHFPFILWSSERLGPTGGKALLDQFRNDKQVIMSIL